jgi:hypothetical protein
LSYQYLILFHKIKTKERLKFSVKAQNLELESVGKAQVSAFSTHFSFKLQIYPLKIIVFPSISKTFARLFASDLAVLGRWAALGYKFYLV